MAGTNKLNVVVDEKFMREHAERYMSTAMEILTTRPGLVPIVFMFKKGEPVYGVPMDFDDSDKHKKYQMLFEAARHRGIEGIIMVNDSYMVKLSKDENWEDNKLVRDDPRRTECILLSWALNTGVSGSIIQPYERKDTGIEWGEREAKDGVGHGPLVPDLVGTTPTVN